MTTRTDDKSPFPDDLANRSDDELYDILTHIDRQLVPERYVAVRDEYVRRHGNTIKGQPIDDYFERARRNRPFAARRNFKKKIFVGLALWSLAMLLLRGILYLQSQR